jgi:predicted tellurium resistance membrane protein TerC
MFEWLASPEAWIASARRLGLGLAMMARLALLYTISWVMRLTDPWLTVFSQAISGRDLILIGGGLFLLAKATHEIHTSSRQCS